MNKKLVAITQSVFQDQYKVELLDSLSHNWTLLLNECGYEPLIIPNNLSNPIEYLGYFKVDKIILTGGNNFYSNILDKNIVKNTYNNENTISERRDLTEIEVIKYAINSNSKIIGVCRGMQLLNLYFGGSISKVSNHVGVNHQIILMKKAVQFMHTENISTEVNSYHNYAILESNLSSGFKVFALDHSQTVIEGFIHEKHKFLGIMWHPERFTPFRRSDKELLNSFFSCV